LPRVGSGGVGFFKQAVHTFHLNPAHDALHAIERGAPFKDFWR
jgi:hypothetical protein